MLLNISHTTVDCYILLLWPRGTDLETNRTVDMVFKSKFLKKKKYKGSLGYFHITFEVDTWNWGQYTENVLKESKITDNPQ